MFGGRTATENYVWNTVSLAWDRMTQPGGGGGGSGTEYLEDNPAAADPQGGGSACYTQDLYFYEDARKHGYRFACDTRVKVGHYYYQNDIVW